MLDLLIHQATLVDGRWPKSDVGGSAGWKIVEVTRGLPGVNQSGTLLEGIALRGEFKPLLTHESDDPHSRHVETLAFETRCLGLQGYGVAAGCNADMVLLQARDPVEAIRLRATRLKIFRRGKVIAESPTATSILALPGSPVQTSWMN